MDKIIKFIDLFAGMGGTRIGLERASEILNLKTECVFTSEIKPYAIKVYNNFFNEKHDICDITKVDTTKIPDFDILLGGFPCQAFSSAGKRLGFEDTRGTLFFEIARILNDKQPNAFILENVEGLIKHNSGKTLFTIINTLESLNYNVSYCILNASDFSLAQTRKRVYIVGSKIKKIDLKFNKEKTVKFKDIQENGLPLLKSDLVQKILEHYMPSQLYGKALKDKRGGKNNIHSWDIGLKGEISCEAKELLNKIMTERRKKIWAKEIGIEWMDGIPLTKSQIETFYKSPNLQSILDDLCLKGYLKFEYPKNKVDNKRVYDITKPKGYNIVAGKLSYEFSSFLNPNDVTPTLVATDIDKVGVIDGEGIRKLSTKEGLRLFGYPDNYPLDIISIKDAYDLLGNTICINVIEKISKKVLSLYKS